MRILHALPLTLLLACGGGADDTGTDVNTTPTATTNGGECADGAFNPFAGSCAEDYWVGCFDPSGTCDGTADAMGNVELIWENGATVSTTLDLSNPLSPGVITELVDSNGALCATGVSENNAGGCASITEYTRADGALLTYCFQADGSGSATCEDGTEISYDAAQASAVETCQYGDAEPCTVDFDMGT